MGSVAVDMQHIRRWESNSSRRASFVSRTATRANDRHDIVEIAVDAAGDSGVLDLDCQLRRARKRFSVDGCPVYHEPVKIVATD